MTQAATEMVHFSITGECVTDTARNIMLGEEPGKAWRLIANSLVGEGAETAARAILDGTMKLVGTNNLELVDEDSEDEDLIRYLRDLHYIYAGRIRINGTWYRPIAQTQLNQESAKYAGEVLGGRNITGIVNRHRRAWAKRAAEWFIRQNEIVHEVDRKWVIFEPCGEFPFWWKELPDVEAAMKDMEQRGRRVEIRGAESSWKEAAEGVVRSLRARSDELDAEADQAERAARRAGEDERESKRKVCLAEIGKKVREQAGDDTFELHIPATEGTEFKDPTPERTITVPRAPFVCWALDRTSLRHLSPEWETVAPVGMKLQLDNPHHTDWMLGAGLDLQKDYGTVSPVSLAAYREASLIQDEVGNFEVHVLVDCGMTKGKVGEAILVLPNLSPEYAEQAMAPGVRAIVAEVGGELAHLSTLGREFGWTIMRVPDAVRRFPEGTTLTLNPQAGRVWVDGE